LGHPGLTKKYSDEFDASALFKKLDHLPPPEAHWTFTSLAAMMLIALADLLDWDPHLEKIPQLLE